MVTISKLVTNGVDTWLFTQGYMYYTQSEAHAKYKETVAQAGYKIVEE